MTRTPLYGNDVLGLPPLSRASGKPTLAKPSCSWTHVDFKKLDKV